jgi:hypothetical protein
MTDRDTTTMPAHAPRRRTRRSPLGVGLAAGLLAASGALMAPAALLPAAAGQIEAFDSEQWVVLTEPTALRSGSHIRWYPVAELDAGTVLIADAVDGGWLRVDYPEGTPAVVLTRDGELDAGRGVVTLTRRSRLNALNVNHPSPALSYRGLFSSDLPPVGTELTYIEDLVGDDGEVGGWVVEAPEGAQGFVLAGATRPATQAEIDRARGGDAAVEQEDAGEAREADTPDDAAGAGELTMGEGTGGSANREEAGETARSTAGGAEDDAPTEPRPRPSAEAAEAQAAAQRDAAPAGEGDAEREAGPISTDDMSGLRGDELLDAVIARAQALETAYKRVLAQTDESAEVAPLIGEYEALKRAAERTSIAERVARVADARITVLEIRRELERTSAEVSAAAEAAERAADDAMERNAERESQIVYQYMGRLRPSAVYDGERLPLRYRLVAEGGARTIAYVEPAGLFTIEVLDEMAGLLVGVAGREQAGGDTETVGSRGVPTVRPSVVDLLEPLPEPRVDPVTNQDEFDTDAGANGS